MPNLKSIFESNYSPLCNYANALINDVHTSEDLVQSVFIQLWENDKLMQLKNPAPYLMRCVKYKCIDHLRKNKSHLKKTSEPLPNIEKEYILELSEEDIAPIFTYLTSQLPPKTRKVFLMSREQGMTYNEIAEELNISVKTVENQMGAALKKLKELLIKNDYLPVLLFYFEKIFNSN